MKITTKFEIVLWYLLALVFSPLLLPMAIRTRKITLRLPEANGLNTGCIAFPESDDLINVTFLGESPVAGVGVDNYAQSLTAQTARHLVQQLNCSINWCAIGENGIAIKALNAQRLDTALESNPDVLVLVMGVNDVTKFKSFYDWQRQIIHLAEATNNSGIQQLLIYGVPPLAEFPALPKPLALLLGYRARIFDKITKQLAFNGEKFHFLSFRKSVEPSHFAKDGYHPSALGCDIMGEQIAVDIIKSRF
ncbi:MAG: SGNH/GDSL hydrolase family protein [Kangiellaceae bacterium]|nr:SGNH/GDSL hydrolase family protein [Kangiellaceae bacterium]